MGRNECLALARRYHEAWTSGDFDEARDLLSTALETDVPINSYSGVAEWMEAVARTRAMAQTIGLLGEYANDRDALLLYEMSFGPPIGTLRIAEQFTIEGERITKIRHVHDTHRLRQAMAASAAHR